CQRDMTIEMSTEGTAGGETMAVAVAATTIAPLVNRVTACMAVLLRTKASGITSEIDGAGKPAGGGILLEWAAAAIINRSRANSSRAKITAEKTGKTIAITPAIGAARTAAATAANTAPTVAASARWDKATETSGVQAVRVDTTKVATTKIA